MTINTSGRLNERINALRKDCIKGLGVKMLQNAYELIDKLEGDSLESALVAEIGTEQFEQYGSKIWQLKFCEESLLQLN